MKSMDLVISVEFLLPMMSKTIAKTILGGTNYFYGESWTLYHNKESRSQTIIRPNSMYCSKCGNIFVGQL